MWIERNASLTEHGFSCRCVKFIPTGIDEKNKISLKTIAIYPNPATERIQIQSDKPIQNAQLAIFNILGEMVFSGIFINEINVSDLQPGLYVAILKTSDNREFRAKFVKEWK